MTILLNIIAVSALFLGRRTRSLLLNGLVGMYHDNEVEKYYDSQLVSNYGTRYLLGGWGHHYAGVNGRCRAAHHSLHILIKKATAVIDRCLEKT